MKPTKSTKTYNLKLTNSVLPFDENFESETSAKRWFIKEFGLEFFETIHIQTSKTSDYFQAPIFEVWDLLKTHKTLIISDRNTWESFLTLTIR